MSFEEISTDSEPGAIDTSNIIIDPNDQSLNRFQIENSLSDPINSDQAREQLRDELDELIERVKEVSPEYSPPPYSPQALIQLIKENLSRLSPQLILGILEQLRNGVDSEIFDPDTWRGIWYMVNYTLDSRKDWVQRRISGEYETDEWGYDPEIMDAVKPFFEFLYKRYWRVEISGIENIPDEGRALLVVNHSGQVPFDEMMVGLSVYNEHPNQRLVRNLYSSWFPTLPVISSLFIKMGQVLAKEENGIRLLEQEQLVATYPEGYKGIGKLYKERYRLARFGNGDFVRMAITTGAPMIPVSVVGAEETYISLAKSDFMAKLLGFPYFPISPTFPWLGLLGLIPIPSKWFIDFGEPIETIGYGSNSADNIILVSQIMDQMRNIVQQMVYSRLRQRESIIFG